MPKASFGGKCSDALIFCGRFAVGTVVGEERVLPIIWILGRFWKIQVAPGILAVESELGRWVHVLKTESSNHSWSAMLADQVIANSRMFFSLARRIVRDAPTAEDICQQAFLRAWEQRQSLQNAPALKSWLARTVINESLGTLRRRKLEQKVLRTHTYETIQETDGANLSVHNRQDILLAIESLPERPRAVVIFRVMQGLSGKETMDLMDCSAGEVSKLLHRGLDQLRHLLSEWKENG